MQDVARAEHSRTHYCELPAHVALARRVIDLLNKDMRTGASWIDVYTECLGLGSYEGFL